MQKELTPEQIKGIADSDKKKKQMILELMRAPDFGKKVKNAKKTKK